MDYLHGCFVCVCVQVGCFVYYCMDSPLLLCVCLCAGGMLCVLLHGLSPLLLCVCLCAGGMLCVLLHGVSDDHAERSGPRPFHLHLQTGQTSGAVEICPLHVVTCWVGPFVCLSVCLYCHRIICAPVCLVSLLYCVSWKMQRLCDCAYFRKHSSSSSSPSTSSSSSSSSSLFNFFLYLSFCFWC